MTYTVSITATRTFTVEADSRAEAEQTAERQAHASLCRMGGNFWTIEEGSEAEEVEP